MLRIVVLLLAVMQLVSPLEAGIWDKIKSTLAKKPMEIAPTLEVLVVHDRPGVVLEVKGKYKIYDPHTNDHISTRFIGKRKFIQAQHEGIKWGEDFPGVHQLLIVPDEGVVTLVDGTEYRGSIYVYDIGGTISVVNQVDIEDYLRSVLAPYAENPLHQETYSAIAIAARTNAYFQMDNPRNPYWAVDASKTNYKGESATKPDTKLEQAIASTKYMVMSLDKGVNETETFANEWLSAADAKAVASPGVLVSKITVAQADELADKDAHAAQILAKAFPKTTIVLTHSAPQATMKTALPVDDAK